MTANTFTYEYLDSETLEVILDLMDGDSEMVIDLVDTLVETTPDLMDDLAEGVICADADKIKGAAHALKSSNAQLGALTFADLCFQMESIGKTNDLMDAEKILELIQEEYKRVNQALESWKEKILEEG
ncbi:MAG: Hpt domain-containing protein [Bacteroidota bacterium]